jgi:hypothetical protein
MTSQDDRLRELLGRVREDEPVPDFDTTWRRAEARSRERRGADAPSRWRWALGPAMAVGAAACAVLLVLALGPGAGDADETGLALLVDAGVIESPLAGLEAPEFPISPLAAAEIEEDEDRPGYGLYVGGTDFLLSLDVPAWEQAGERNVL